MSKVIKIKKGLNINLVGEALRTDTKEVSAPYYAIKPTDFIGVFPKIMVSEGDNVKMGSPLFVDKNNPSIHFTAPVSGKIKTIVRGEKRLLEAIIIESDHLFTPVEQGIIDPNTISSEAILERLLVSGVWPLIRQRPFDTIANPADKPKAIFISTFDTHPLAPDNDYVVHGKGKTFQTGLDALSKLTDGKIHLNVNADYASSKVFANAKNVDITEFSGPHPAGNVGVQIHHLNPLNKGEVIWYLYPQDVLAIGRLFEKGYYDATRVIALTGSEVINPKYYKVKLGIQLSAITHSNINVEKEVRYISGNVLTGKKIDVDGFVNYYHTQVTVIPEGKYFDFLGWALPGFDKYSFSRTFFSWMMPDKRHTLDTNYHGGERAYVMTGEYEKVFPMDIYPQLLVKAILAEDIDKMEKLGIYEVSEEDFALCEFICTSKIEVQEIVRKGLDLVLKEMK